MTSDGQRDSPFVGPRPFGAAEADDFFGRERETDALASLVISHRAVLLYAVSGAGKTSLLSAGLIPALAEHGFEVLGPLRVGAGTEDPPPAQNAFVHPLLVQLRHIGDEDGTLVAALAALERGSDRYGFPCPRLLILDQFEELFTVHQERWQEREELFTQIAAALDDDPSLRVLFALREEYLAPLERYGAVLPDGLRARLHLERLRRAAALTATTEPLRRAGVEIEPGVADTLVSDLEHTRVDLGEGRIATVPGEFVEPVHLQVVCRTLWSRLDPRVKAVKPSDLALLGSVDDSLTAYYETAMDAAIARSGVKEHRFRRAFEEAFITSADTRATVFAGSGASRELPGEALDELADRHLIRGEWRAGGRWLELAHDRLIEPIRRANAAARDRVRRRRVLTGGVAALLLAAIVGGGTALSLQKNAEPTAREVGLTTYPGDDAPKPARARWMAATAIAHRIPPELPIMAALVESNLENLPENRHHSAGFFQMSTEIWDQDEKYRGFADDPQLQLQWFLDAARAVREQRIAAGLPDPAGSPRRYGAWVADIERPVAQYRGRYQLRLEEAQRLVGSLVAAD